MTKLDKIDRQILTLMQADASLPIQQIADQVGLSVNPCWRRIRQMEQEGVIGQPNHAGKREILIGEGGGERY